MSARDTQFKQFADMLYDELKEEWLVDWKFSDAMRKLIARRAYDLVVHTLSNTEHINLDRLTEEEHAARIPDMVEWPEN